MAARKGGPRFVVQGDSIVALDDLPTIDWAEIERRVVAYPKHHQELTAAHEKLRPAAERIARIKAAADAFSRNPTRHPEAVKFAKAVVQFIAEGPEGAYGVGSGPDAFARWGF